MIEKRVEEAGWSGRCEKLDKVIAGRPGGSGKIRIAAARQKTSASNAGVRTVGSAPTNTKRISNAGRSF
jgi:hypothetical protein